MLMVFLRFFFVMTYRIRLLAYSPLAMGVLSGKYLLSDGGANDARLNLFKGRYSEGESRYSLSNPTIREATKVNPISYFVKCTFNVHMLHLII